MINNKEVEKIIIERIEIHPDDPRIMEKWNELTQIFVRDEEDTILYFNNCNMENIYWISEIFEDISEQLQSDRFIECIDQLSIKFPELDLEQDILYAKEVME
ncbi:MAG: hypothetical protein HFJ07_18940 [Lachnospiraceae bacterium]|nr:hypothetical protein [Lachnospiraceae bacterium]